MDRLGLDQEAAARGEAMTRDDDDRRRRHRRWAGWATAAALLAGGGVVTGLGPATTTEPPTATIATPTGAVTATIDTQPAATEQATTAVVPVTSIPQVVTVACGTERWPVKTLQDKPTLTGPVASTIDALDAMPATPGGQDTRSPAESTIYSVTGKIAFEKLEADSDMHVVLQAGDGATMIAEFPDPGCTLGADPAYRNQMAAARSDLLAHFPVGSTVTVTGVLFFDRPHGQTGVAPNAVELHPALAVTGP